MPDPNRHTALDIDTLLRRRRLLMVGGKGGVGKTTVASALALRAASLERRVLLVSTDPAHSLADAFDREIGDCLLYTSPSPRDLSTSRMPSSA